MSLSRMSKVRMFAAARAVVAAAALSRLLPPLIGAAVLSSCVAPAQRNSHADAWIASPNFGPRSVSLVVLHHTSSNEAATALTRLLDPLQAVSAHYLISKGGRITQLVDERERAWHAGISRWGPITDVNGASIGIELDNNGEEAFPAAQMTALYRLLDDLKSRYHLTPLAFVGHADVAPARKVDPSAQFSWREMAQHGFGLWCDPPIPAASANFDTLLGLQALGYDLAVPDAAADAFAQHYGMPRDGIAALDPALVNCIVQQARNVPVQ